MTTGNPRIVPPLDPKYRPAVLVNRAFDAQCKASGEAVPVTLAVEQGDGSVFRHETCVLPNGHPDAAQNARHLERLTKFLLWSRGGYRVYVAGPAELASPLKAHYTDTEIGRFDADIMGTRVYGKPFEVVSVGHPDEIPASKGRTAPLGRHLEGCRIGFDLGASDRKAAAVIDGKVVFSEEKEWHPVPQTDPTWHFNEIMDSLKSAAAHLPRVDAIGGSSAGVLVNNQVRLASLFRGVPIEQFNSRVANIFFDIKRAWDDIPFEIVNDGEVTALAGSMSINSNGVLGIAMGSSEAVGYVNPEGNITSWLNELAFAPVDYHPEAAPDEWSGDRGCGVQYFSQQGVGRLIPAAGIELDPAMGLPDRLKQVQALMNDGDARALGIYESIGIYLGYTLAHYADFYDYHNVLILGRVTTGPGGEVILDKAREVLKAEFSPLAERISFHVPDEKEKRHGQAIAAASLPAL